MTRLELEKTIEQAEQIQRDFANLLVSIILKHDVYEHLRLEDESNGDDKWLLADVYKDPFWGTRLRTVCKAHASCCNDEYFYFELPIEIFHLDINSNDIERKITFILDKWLLKLKLEDEHKRKLEELEAAYDGN